MLVHAMSGTSSPPLRLPKRVRVSVAKRARSLREPHRVVVRAQLIMLAVAGVSTAEIGRRLGLSESCVRKWRRRMEARPRVNTLRDAPRSGRPTVVPTTVRCELVKLACQRPADRPTAPLGQVWTRPMLQQALLKETDVLLSLSEITRTLRCGGLRPHRVRMWLHSPDPQFGEKVKRVCALYLSPPPGATVVCVDEKPGMQALEHLHPLHVVRGVNRREFEYKRHGTSTLIAAFDIRSGEVFGRLWRRTSAGIVRFMEQLAKKYPRGPSTWFGTTSTSTTTAHRGVGRSSTSDTGTGSTSCTPRSMRLGSTRSRSGSASCLDEFSRTLRSQASAN